MDSVSQSPFSYDEPIGKRGRKRKAEEELGFIEGETRRKVTAKKARGSSFNVRTTDIETTANAVITSCDKFRQETSIPGQNLILKEALTLVKTLQNQTAQQNPFYLLANRVFSPNQIHSVQQAHYSFNEIIKTIFQKLEHAIQEGDVTTAKLLTKQMKIIQKTNLLDMQTVSKLGERLIQMYRTQNNAQDALKAMKVFLGAKIPPEQSNQFESIATKYTALFNIALESKNITEQWKIIEAFQQTVGLLDASKYQLFEQEALDLLDCVIKTKKEKNKSMKLTQEQIKNIESFLFYAFQNSDLNARLRAKTEKSPAENFIIEFSYKSKLIETYKSTSTVLEKNFQAMKFDAIQETYEEIKETFTTDIGGFIKDVTLEVDSIKNKVEIAKKDRTLEPYEIEAYNKLLTATGKLSDVCSQFNSVLPHSQTSLEAFEREFTKAKTALLNASNELSVINSSLTVHVSTIQTMFDTRFSPKITTIQTRQQQLEQFELQCIQAQAAGGIVSLSLAQFKCLKSLEGLQSIIEKLCKKNPALSTIPIIKEFITIGETAEEFSEKLDSLLQIFPSYTPGDLLFQEEAKEHTYESKKVYSNQGLLTNIRDPSVWKMIRNADVFGLRPIFAGRYLHSSIVNINEGEVKQAEVVGEYYNNAIPFSDALFSEVFRIDMEALITDDGRKALAEMFPEMTETERIQWIAQRYQQKTNQFFQEFAERLKNEGISEINNSAKKAAMALVKDMGLNPAQWRLFASERPELENWTLGGPFVGYDMEKCDLDKPEGIEMFCSEFNARCLIICMNLLQTELSTEYVQKTQKGILKPGALPARPIAFFKEIIPKTESFTAIHPQKLYNIIRKFYTAVAPPFAVSLLAKPIE